MADDDVKIRYMSQAELDRLRRQGHSRLTDAEWAQIQSEMSDTPSMEHPSPTKAYTVNPATGFAREAPGFQMLPNIPQGRSLVSNGNGGGGFSMPNLEAAGGNANAHLGQKKMESIADEITKQTKITYDSSTDLATVQVPSWVLQKVMGDSLKMQDIEAIYTKQMAENEARIQNLKSHPFINTLSQIAASMAANDPNPYTRGIGQAAQRLNPTLDQLQDRQLGVAKELGTMREREYGKDVGLMEFYEREAARVSERKTRHEEFLARQSEVEARNRESERFHDLEVKKWEAYLDEQKKTHAERAREFDQREKDYQLKRGEIDITKQQNVYLRYQSELEKTDKDIANLHRQMNDMLTNIQKAQPGEVSAMSLRKYNETQRRMIEEIENMKKRRDAIQAKIDKMDEASGTPAKSKKPLPAGVKSDPAGLF